MECLAVSHKVIDRHRMTLAARFTTGCQGWTLISRASEPLGLAGQIVVQGLIGADVMKLLVRRARPPICYGFPLRNSICWEDKGFANSMKATPKRQKNTPGAVREVSTRALRQRCTSHSIGWCGTDPGTPSQLASYSSS